MLSHVEPPAKNISPFPAPGAFAKPSPASSNPAPAPAPIALSGDAANIKIINPDGAPELILIVDDEDFVNLLAQRVLTDEGYRVVTARDGFQALDIYKKIGDKIKLILLDFTMPIMDGSEVFD